jgi:phosphoribosylglycinamide formyltransferase 2
MVTLAGTQNFTEFELHARTVLGLPIPEITLERAGVSAVVLAKNEANVKTYKGIEEALKTTKTDIRIFGKPTTRKYRRMAVALAYDDIEKNIETIKKKAISASKKIKIITH